MSRTDPQQRTLKKEENARREQFCREHRCRGDLLNGEHTLATVSESNSGLHSQEVWKKQTLYRKPEHVVNSRTRGSVKSLRKSWRRRRILAKTLKADSGWEEYAGDGCFLASKCATVQSFQAREKKRLFVALVKSVHFRPFTGPAQNSLARTPEWYNSRSAWWIPCRPRVSSLFSGGSAFIFATLTETFSGLDCLLLDVLGQDGISSIFSFMNSDVWSSRRRSDLPRLHPCSTHSISTR